MRVKSKLSVIISEDAEQDFKVFSVEDLEENDDEADAGDGKGSLTLPKSPDSGYDLTLDFAPLTALKNLVILANGSVKVFLSGSSDGILIESTGTFGADGFIYGKLMIRGDEITEVRFVNQSTTDAAKLMVGYAG